MAKGPADLEGWATDDDLRSAYARFAAGIPGFVLPAAYGVAREDRSGLTFGHVNRPGRGRCRRWYSPQPADTSLPRRSLGWTEDGSRLHTLLGMRQPTSARAADTGSTARQIESADPPDDATGTARPAREKDSLIGLITRSAAEEYVDLLVSKGG
jgi:hypothetical protein